MKGHELGVWSLNYFPDGKRLVSASSDGMAKIWDANSGKCTATLKKHTKRVYNAVANAAGTHVASVGSDRMLCLWDTRNLAKPVFVNEQSQSCIMSCDWLPDQKAVVSSTLEGVINVCDIQSQQMTLGFDTVAEMSADGERDVQSNICYRVKGLKNHPGGGNKFAVGAEMKFINVCDYDGARSEEVRLQTYGKFVGHRHSVRDI